MKIFFISLKKIIICFAILIMIITLLAFNLNTEENEYNKTIIIDAGHGGIDPGTHLDKITEKDINLKIAQYLADYLTNKNIEVIMTRTDDSLYQDDRNKDIMQRVEMTNQSQADLMVSIHVNSFSTAKIFGGQVFYSPDSNKGKKLATEIQEKLIEIQPDNRRNIAPGPYYILRKTNVTAVLIETGFITNPQDKKRLTSSQGQKITAQAIGDGIITYLENNPSFKETSKKTLVQKNKRPFVWPLIN